MQLNMSQNQINKLLGLAGNQLGMSPDQLKAQIESGNLSELTSKLSPDQTAQVNQVLNNPAAIGELLKNPQVASTLQNLLKGK